MTTDTSAEAVAKSVIKPCAKMVVDARPLASSVANLLIDTVHALEFERTALSKKLAGYSYIGKGGKPVLVRDLENERDALRAELEEMTAIKDIHQNKRHEYSEQLAEARNAALEEAAATAYGPMPSYGHEFNNPDSLGRIKPGSPYDRGGYDAANRILSLKTTGEDSNGH